MSPRSPDMEPPGLPPPRVRRRSSSTDRAKSRPGLQILFCVALVACGISTADGYVLHPVETCVHRQLNWPKELVEIAPTGLSKVLFAPSGSDAIEMALAYARATTGRFKTISF